jgi:mannose-6-phosphate isomerase-like protein (cupin superfamily)
MKDVKSYIESGILEAYVMGFATDEEIAGVKQMAAQHDEIRKEIEVISETLQVYAESKNLSPDITVKSFIMGVIDYQERLKKGEQPTFPPVLNENSKIKDFSEWLDRDDMFLPVDFSDFYVKIIGFTPEAQTAIVWIEKEAPYETHKNEHEKFLILEGTCDIIVNGKVNSLRPNDYFTIPLYADHQILVTSSIPCKIILQRVAA